MTTKQFTKTEIIFIKLCHGLVQTCDRINQGQPAYKVDYSQPFPQSLHEAFQTLSMKWIRQEEHKLRHPSILCMIEAARRSVSEIDPAFEDFVDFPDQPLVERMSHPSEECEAWASEYGLSLERDQNQSYIPRLMNEIKRFGLPESTYTHFRRFIAENPFPTDADLAMLKHRCSDIEPVSNLLLEAYREPPTLPSSVSLCKTCGGFLDCAAKTVAGCCEKLETSVTRVPIPDTVICLIRPALIEMRLFKALQKLGLEVDLWPSLDQVDIAIKFLTGEMWALDAKDWGSATRLARELEQETIPDVGQSRSFFVIPDYRWNDLAYRSTFLSRYHKSIPVLSEQMLLAKAEENI